MRKTFAGVLAGLVAALLVLGIDALFSRRSAGEGPLQTIELKTYDWRLTNTATPSAARKDIALVEIDEYSLKNLEADAGRWPWPRIIHSMVLDFLARAPARLVAYDVDFAEDDSRSGFQLAGSTWTGAESDRALVDAVKKSGNVILPANATFEGEAVVTPRPWPDTGLALDTTAIQERKVIFPPFGALKDVAAALGHNVFVLDPDGPLRHTVPFVRTGSRVMPSLGLVVALRALGTPAGAVRIDGDRLRFGDRSMPLSTRLVRSGGEAFRYHWGLVNFRGPALLPDGKSGPYLKFSAYDLISAENDILEKRKPAIDPAVFKDKIVFVGVTAAGLFDVFETPFAGGKMPGIQVNAAVVDDVLSNRFVRPGGTLVRVLIVLSAALGVGILSVLVPAWWATLAVSAFLAGYTWLSLRLMAGGYWLNLSQPALASSLALFGGVAYQYFFEGREKRKMKRLFGQYVSKDVYDQLVAHPELARLGGQRRDMTVLFSDIRGFTTVTERGQPEEIVGMLNEYFTRMVDIVFQNNGTLDKFVGDMVMALFGAPLDDPDHADHAVEAALQMIEGLGQLNRTWHTQGRFAQLDIGIGINTGPMIAGNIGSEAIMSYTVIGDAVNLGSRLESLNKQYGTRIIISEATKDRLKGRYHFRPLGDVVVKGKTQPVKIFELAGRGDGILASPTVGTIPTTEAHS